MPTIQWTHEVRCSFEWDEANRNAFKSIKKYLTKPLVLRALVPSQPLILTLQHKNNL